MSEQDAYKPTKTTSSSTPKSEPAISFYKDYMGVQAIVATLITGTALIDQYYDTLYASLVTTETFEKELNRLGRAGVKTILSAAYHESVMAQMILCRLADSFLVYLTDLLVLLFHKEPRMLKSSEVEPLDFILEYSTMEDLMHALAEKRVEKLAHMGMADLKKFFSNNLKLPLFQDAKSEESVTQVIELRNIIVHNHAVVSSTFKRRVPSFPAEVGTSIKIGYAKVREDAEALRTAVDDIDERIVAKYILPARTVGLRELFPSSE